MTEPLDDARGELLALADRWRCPHDMGFDNELGPLGCLLVSKSLECVCENHHFATPRSRSDAESVEAAARAMQGANAIKMLVRQPWDSVPEQEREHWLFLAKAAALVTEGNTP